MAKEPLVILDDILKTAKADGKMIENYRNRLEKGAINVQDNPISHFCVYFAAYDPINKLVFIGLHKKSGLWLFNGGHIDKNETPKQALKREIKEEWGIDMDVDNLAPKLLTITNIVSNPAKRPCQTHFDIWFFIPQDRNKFAPDNNLLFQEFHEAGWKTFNEARCLAKDPNTLKGINEIEKI